MGTGLPPDPFSYYRAEGERLCGDLEADEWERVFEPSRRYEAGQLNRQPLVRVGSLKEHLNHG